MSPGGVRSQIRWREQLPEPGLLWVRWSPRPWPGPDQGVWTDLARSGIGWGGSAESARPVPRPEGRCLEDLVYLPPAAQRFGAEQVELAAELAAQGTPVLLQLLPGDAAVQLDGVEAVHDLLPTLWHRDCEPLLELPPGATTVWPLIPGVTDGADVIDEGIDRLARAGVSRVVGIDLELSPGDRREVVVSHGDQLFDLLFHRRSSAERRFARAAADAGLHWWLDRPLPSPPMLRVGNRRLAGLLLTVADLWSRLGRPPEQGQAYYRAARWIDDSRYDVEALLREGNLELVATIDDASHAALTELLEAGRSAILERMREAWLDGGDSDGGG